MSRKKKIAVGGVLGGALAVLALTVFSTRQSPDPCPIEMTAHVVTNAEARKLEVIFHNCTKRAILIRGPLSLTVKENGMVSWVTQPMDSYLVSPGEDILQETAAPASGTIVAVKSSYSEASAQATLGIHLMNRFGFNRMTLFIMGHDICFWHKNQWHDLRTEQVLVLSRKEDDRAHGLPL